MSPRKRRSSVSDDEDNVPLKLIRVSTIYDDDPNSYNSLCMPNNQPCELCDQVSKNRYRSLIHNVRHIIIPLINQNVFQCDICLYHFTSESDLHRHKSRKHSLNLVRKSYNNSENSEDEICLSDLVTIVKKENECNFKTDCTSKPIYEEDKINTSQCNNFSLKSRLLFEEDIINDRLLADLTTDCKVNVEWFPPIWGEPEYPTSVHYDDLVKPGVFRCKKCVRTFPNRFAAITHESSHIFFKNSQITLCKLCNQWILGDINKLKYHQLISHSQNSPPRDKRPLKKYFGGVSVENGVIEEPFITKMSTFKICDICFSFCKNNSTHKYDCVGELNEIGKRHRCQKCGQKFFVVKLVNRESKYRCSSFSHRKNKKVMTNHDRLKNIAQRLKRMKKPYIFLLFIIRGCVGGNLPVKDFCCLLFVDD